MLRGGRDEPDSRGLEAADPRQELIGHRGAAGLVGVGDAEAILNICMQKSMAFMRKLK